MTGQGSGPVGLGRRGVPGRPVACQAGAGSGQVALLVVPSHIRERKESQTPPCRLLRQVPRAGFRAAA
jgi:hypothetical protein